MNQYKTTTKNGGKPHIYIAYTPEGALEQEIKRCYDPKEWYVSGNWICNNMSGWRIEYKVEKL